MNNHSVEQFVGSDDSSLEKISKDALEAKGIVEGVHEQVQLVMENRDIKTYVLEIADKIDENIAMEKLRKFWEYMPNALRWCIMHVPNSIPDVFVHTTKQLVYCGFLPYREDPAENEEYARNSEKYQKLILEWGVKIGAYFVPELEAVELLMGPIGDIIDVTDNLKGEIRRHLSQKHLLKKGKVEIANAIKTKPVESSPLKLKQKSEDLPAGKTQVTEFITSD